MGRGDHKNCSVNAGFDSWVPPGMCRDVALQWKCATQIFWLAYPKTTTPTFAPQPACDLWSVTILPRVGRSQVTWDERPECSSLKVRRCAKVPHFTATINIAKYLAAEMHKNCRRSDKFLQYLTGLPPPKFFLKNYKIERESRLLTHESLSWHCMRKESRPTGLRVLPQRLLYLMCTLALHHFFLVEILRRPRSRIGNFNAGKGRATHTHTLPNQLEHQNSILDLDKMGEICSLHRFPFS